MPESKEPSSAGGSVDAVNGDINDPAVREAKQVALFKLCATAMVSKGLSSKEIFEKMKGWLTDKKSLKDIGVIDGKVATHVFRQLQAYEVTKNGTAPAPSPVAAPAAPAPKPAPSAAAAAGGSSSSSSSSAAAAASSAMPKPQSQDLVALSTNPIFRKLMVLEAAAHESSPSEDAVA